jgi:hypothetical protein
MRGVRANPRPTPPPSAVAAVVRDAGGVGRVVYHNRGMTRASASVAAEHLHMLIKRAEAR